MIRFVSKLSVSGKTNLGIAMLPADLARLMNGEPEFIELSELEGLEPANLESVSIFFFRDKFELQEELQRVGVEVLTK